MKCSDIEKQLGLFIPKGLAQTDKKENTGLIVGRSDKNVSTIIVAYRIDQEIIDYAVSAQADMIISYEPIIEEPILTIESTNYQGRLLLQLLRHDIACYATGSSFDKCKGGSADWLASRLELSGVYITQPQASYAGMEDTVCQSGKGRIGYYKKKKSLEELTDMICNLFSLEGINAYISKRDDGLTFSDVAVVVWADEKSIEAAMERGVQLIVTCGVSSKEAMKACSEHRAVLELPGETAAHIFETCVEQYLSEVLSSSIEILTIPMQRKSRFLKCRKE